MRRAFLAGALLPLLAAAGLAWEWPISEAQPISTFGQSERGSYSRGMGFRVQPGPVFSIAEGEVVFSRADDAGLRSRAGSVVIVDHATGFRSIYTNLDPGSIAPVGTMVDEDTAVGTVGMSSSLAGRAGVGGDEWHLLIFDTQAGVFVNPLLLLPAVDDRTPPVIRSVYLRDSGALFDLSLELQVPPGSYELLISCDDLWQNGGEPVAPYSVAVLQDGMELLSVVHDGFVISDGTLLSQPDPGRDYEGLRSRAGEFVVSPIVVPEGRVLLEVIVADFFGNVTSLAREIGSVR